MLVLVLPLAAREPLAQRIAHTDPAKYQRGDGGPPGVGQGPPNLVYIFYHSVPSRWMEAS